MCCSSHDGRGEQVRIPESSLVAGKVVPAAPARRRGPPASYEELARAAARAWQPVESERLGGWELRAAGGFTRRANSVLPLGDPGLPLDEALARVRALVRGARAARVRPDRDRRRGHAGAAVRGAGGAGLGAEVTAEMRIGALAPIADRRGRPATAVGLARGAATRRGSAAISATGASEVALKVLSSGPSVWFATVPGDERARPPRSGGAWSTGGGPVSRPSRWIRPGGARAWPPR